jgi:two-component system sensor histidine kinase KdpD
MPTHAAKAGSLRRDSGKESREKNSGKPRAGLKIYLGICPGAGKTRAMLADALKAREEGKDIVVALAEIREKNSTSVSYLEKLESLPRTRVEYRGLFFDELDVEGAFERHPEIAVIDNLAYSNIPGSRHLKRWQDVVELLDRGIGVWTAVDIQNLESLSDVVEDICGIHFPEVVPDSVIDMADETVFVDAMPESVLERRRSKKIRIPAILAGKENGFYTTAILSAFRDLALRYTARKPDGDGPDPQTDRQSPQVPNLGEHIIVAVGPSPGSAHLVRFARRTAHSLRADWTAVHVDSGLRLADEDRLRLEATLNLARRLGAQTMIIRGNDVASTLLETARTRKASSILIGRSAFSRRRILPGWPGLSDRIVRDAGKIAVMVVQDEKERKPPRRGFLRGLFSAPPKNYLLLLLLFLAVTALGFLLDPFLGYRSVTLIYLAAVLGFSFIASPAAISILAVLSALALNFLFIPPLFTFTIGSPEDWILFAIYFLVAFVTGHLVSRLRTEERMLAEKEKRSEFLYSAASKLAECRSAKEAADVAADILKSHFGLPSLVCIGTEDEGQDRQIRTGSGSHSEEPGAGMKDYEPSRELNAIRYVFSSATVCGKKTGNFPACAYRYLPARAGEKVLGVIGLAIGEDAVWTEADDGLAISLGHTLALTLDRAASEARSRRISLELESDRMSRILLDSVSHELRTPLTTIMGSISALGEDGLAVSAEARKHLLSGALGAAENLDRIVEDLLSISRIESGMLTLHREIQDMDELAANCLKDAGEIMEGREVRVSRTGSGSPEIDTILVAKLGANLLRNAAAYSPAGSPVDLTLASSGPDFILSVRDYGPGIPRETMRNLFGKFRRGSHVPGTGLGLGLAICKGIMAAHGGTIELSEATGGGIEAVAIFPDCVGGG